MLLASHLPLPVAIGFAVYAARRFTSSILFATVFASVVYHSCQAANACLFGSSVDTLRMLDYDIAFSNFIIVFDLLIPEVRTWFPASDDEVVRNEYRWMLFWGDILKYFMFIFILTIVSVYALTPGALGGSFANLAVLAAVAVLTGLFIYVLVISRGVMQFYSKFDWRYVLPGVILLGIGVVMFLVDINGAYAITHSIWHFCSFVGYIFLIIGTNAGVFAPMIRASCCGQCRDVRRDRKYASA